MLPAYFGSRRRDFAIATVRSRPLTWINAIGLVCCTYDVTGFGLRIRSDTSTREREREAISQLLASLGGSQPWSELSELT